MDNVAIYAYIERIVLLSVMHLYKIHEIRVIKIKQLLEAYC